MKTIGFLGAGRLAQMLAPKILKAGWGVILSNSRGPETLSELVSTLGEGARAATPEAMVKASDIVVLAVRWPQLEAATKGLDWNGKIVVDATNNRLGPKPEDVIDIGGVLSSKIVGDLISGAHLVKAFNHEPIPVFDQALPPKGDATVLYLAGADAKSNGQVAELMKALGATPVDLGPVDKGGLLIAMGGPLANKFKLLTPDEASAAISAAG